MVRSTVQRWRPSRCEDSTPGLATDVENDTTCCYALQDKGWVHGPGQEPWEFYVVKADAEAMTKQKAVPCCTGPAESETAKVQAGGCCP